jgi:hypothetical protein
MSVSSQSEKYQISKQARELEGKDRKEESENGKKEGQEETIKSKNKRK